MNKFLLLSLIIVVIFFVIKNIFYSAKRNLFKDQESWSGKDIEINYINSKEIPEPKRNENYLKVIAEESKLYLEDQLHQDAD